MTSEGPDRDVLRKIGKMSGGHLPLAILKMCVVCDDPLYLYIDTGMTPEQFRQFAADAKIPEADQ